jgi:hypothetical protein
MHEFMIPFYIRLLHYAGCYWLIVLSLFIFISLPVPLPTYPSLSLSHTHTQSLSLSSFFFKQILSLPQPLPFSNSHPSAKHQFRHTHLFSLSLCTPWGKIFLEISTFLLFLLKLIFHQKCFQMEMQQKSRMCKWVKEKNEKTIFCILRLIFG